MTPIWVTILVGLGSGLLATGWRISYERGVELRTRMLSAADDFVVDTRRAHRALETLVPLRYGEPPEEEEWESRFGTADEPGDDELGPEHFAPEDVWSRPTLEALARAKAALNVVDERLARIGLLFGDYSDTTAAAVRAVHDLRGSLLCVLEIPQDPKELAWGLLVAAGEREDEFNEAARAALWRPPAWSRLTRRSAAERRTVAARKARQAEGRETALANMQRRLAPDRDD